MKHWMALLALFGSLSLKGLVARGSCAEPTNEKNQTPQTGSVVKVKSTTIRNQCLVEVQLANERISAVSTTVCDLKQDRSAITFKLKTPCCDGGEQIGCEVRETFLGMALPWKKPLTYPVLDLVGQKELESKIQNQ